VPGSRLDAQALSGSTGHPLTERECLILDRIGRDRTHKDIAAELGVSINTVANLAAKAYRKLGAHGAAAAVLAHRDAHPWRGTRNDFGRSSSTSWPPAASVPKSSSASCVIRR